MKQMHLQKKFNKTFVVVGHCIRMAVISLILTLESILKCNGLLPQTLLQAYLFLRCKNCKNTGLSGLVLTS